MVSIVKPIVLIIDKLSPPGGAQRLVVDDINSFLEKGVHVQLITLRKANAETSLVSQCLLEKKYITDLHFRTLFDLHSWWMLLRIFHKLKPDVVVTHLWFSNVIGRIAAILTRVKTIISFEHNVYDTVKSRRQFALDRFLALRTTRIVAVSEAVAHSLARHGISGSRVTVLLNAINIKRFTEIDRNVIRNKFGISENEFIFLFAGRLTHQKGVDILLSAFKDVTQGTLYIVGDGEDRDKLHDLSKQIGIDSRVKFLGIRHDMPELYKITDVFVLPSRWEGLVIVMMEAMASGLPIIASRIDGMNELVEEGRNGILISPENISELSEAMRTLLTDRSRRESMAYENLKDSKKFDIQSHSESLLHIINSEHSIP